MNPARFALFSRANSRPRKRLYRTVLRALLLSKQERNKRCFRGADGGKNGSRPGAEQALKTRLYIRCVASWARQSPVHCANQTERMAAPKANQAPGWLWAGFGLDSRIRFLAVLVLNGIQPALPLLARSEIKSKFKAPKTPLSHGFRGFAAIKEVANRRWFPACRRPRKAADTQAPEVCPADSDTGPQHLPCPATGASTARKGTAAPETGAKNSPRKTPPSHGFRGLAAIKKRAKFHAPNSQAAIGGLLGSQA